MDIDPLKIFGKIIVSVVAVIVAILLFIAFFTGRCSAESAIVDITKLDCPADTVSFTDAIDLIRKTNSVIAVKDTVIHPQVWRHEFDYDTVCSFVFMGDTCNIMVPLPPFDSTLVTLVVYPDIRIRSRNLVGVEVISNPQEKVSERGYADWLWAEDKDRWRFEPIPIDTIPGTAIIWFERRDE